MLRPEVISFDCCGTLLDAESGLAQALHDEAGIESPELIERLLEARIEAEWQVVDEIEDFLPYREVLAMSLVRAGGRAGWPISAESAARVAAGMGAWPLFEDVRPALESLGARAKIALVTNAERRDAGRWEEALGIPVTHLVCAEDVSAYLPEQDHLLALLHELVIDEEELLHVSSNAEDDLETAQDLGIPAAYLNRRSESLPDEVEVALVVGSMSELSKKLGRSRGGSRRRRSRS
jgi:2-haloalkanoic acid dehalogenase type II